MGIGMIVLVGVVLVLGLVFVAGFNGLVRMRQAVLSAWAQIDVQLKRRHDLVPNLVEAVKGYLAHERQTLEQVIQARNGAVSASGVAQKAVAENQLTQTLRSLFAVVERYPDLKANQNMLALQEELTSTENKIAYARQYYNEEAKRLNSAVESIPTNMIAALAMVRKAEFFELEDAAQREAPRVTF